jgi:hypothetical protein
VGPGALSHPILHRKEAFLPPTPTWGDRFERHRSKLISIVMAWVPGSELSGRPLLRHTPSTFARWAELRL